jgi:transmembrane sensor
MNMTTKTEDPVLEEAARWHARLLAPDCSQEDRVAFAAWHGRDPSHAQAYARAAQLWRALPRAAAGDARLQALARKAYAEAAAEPPRRIWNRRTVPLALAATVAAVAVGVRVAGSLSGNLAAEASYSASADQPRTVVLADGSVVHIDAASDIKVQMAPHYRHIDLISGRAYFEVAHDASRPFSVYAGRDKVTALGTHFQVERATQDVVVTLAQGSISVDEQNGAAAHREILVPGEQLRISADQKLWTKHHVDPQLVTSWSRGRLIFHDTPLAEALQEVNRYATKKVRLGDPDLARQPVSGNVIAGNSALAVSAFSAVLPLRAVDSGSEIILFERRDAGGG